MAADSLEPTGEPRKSEPIAPLTTLGLGGSAQWLTVAEIEDDLMDALLWASERELPVTLLGGGSNVVVADEGIQGLVVRIATRGVEVRRDGDDAVMTVAAGEEWDGIVAFAVEQRLAGLECLSGIPGTAGATPIQNVGAYGAEVGEVLESVRLLDRVTTEVRDAGAGELRLGYRSSRLRREPGRFIVLSVRFRLAVDGTPRIHYPELARLLDCRSSDPSLALVREAVLELRRSKSMVIDPDDPNHRSAGSFFKNPILAQAAADELIRRIHRTGIAEDPPLFPTANGVKFPAGWLIEKAGFEKGLRRGNVGLSSRHSLALVNRGGGTAAELLGLAREIQTGVRQRFGVELEPEPVFLGFDTANPLRDAAGRGTFNI